MQKQLEFKKFSKQLGFLSLLVGKIIPVVYAKIAKDLGYINYLVIEKDIGKLVSLHPLLVDHLKNYNILMSSGMILAEAAGSIDFNRKLIFKWIPSTAAGKKSKDKHMNVIVSNLDSLQLSLPQIEESLSFFATLYDTAAKKGKGGGEEKMVEITSLQGAHDIVSKQIKIILGMVETIKKFAKQNATGSGDGVIDQIDDEKDAIENEYEPILGSGDEEIIHEFAPISTVKVGGYSGTEREFVGNYIINDRYVAADSAFKYLNRLASGGGQNSFGTIHKSLWGNWFPMVNASVSSKPIDSYHELRALCQVSSDDYAKMLTSFLKLDHLVVAQKNSIKKEHIQLDMSDYLQRHAKKYLDLDLDPSLGSEDDFVGFAEKFLDKLDDLDKKIIDRYATAQPPPGYRTVVKNKLRSDLSALKAWQPAKVPFIKCVGTFIGDDEFLALDQTAQAKKVVEMAHEMLKVEKNHRDIISLEKSYTKQAELLGQFYNSTELKHLIQAGYVETCIMKEIGDLKK